MTYLDYLRSIPVIGKPADWEPDPPTCPTCGEAWYPDSVHTWDEFTRFHAGCKEFSCDLCGQPTNTPDACFDCYHAPFGIGWEQDMMESAGYR